MMKKQILIVGALLVILIGAIFSRPALKYLREANRRNAIAIELRRETLKDLRQSRSPN